MTLLTGVVTGASPRTQTSDSARLFYQLAPLCTDSDSVERDGLGPWGVEPMHAIN